MNKDILYMIASQITDANTFRNFIIAFKNIHNKEALILKWKKIIDENTRKKDSENSFKYHFYLALDLFKDRNIDSYQDRFRDLYASIFNCFHTYKVEMEGNIKVAYFDDEMAWFMNKMKNANDEFKNYIGSIFGMYYRYRIADYRKKYDLSVLETATLKIL